MNMVNEEVKRRVWANAESGAETQDGEVSDTQSASESTPRSSYRYSEVAYPKESDKLLLLNLLGQQPPPPLSPRQQQTVVRRVITRRVSDSSSDDERGSAPSSPQFSHRTDSEYAASDSVRSSLRSTSAVSSDGRITVVTETASVISGISTAPPSMFEGQDGRAEAASKTSPDSAIENPSYSSSKHDTLRTPNGAAALKKVGIVLVSAQEMSNMFVKKGLLCMGN